MKNLNTDTSKFKTEDELKIWQLIQKIEFGLDGELLLRQAVVKYWDQVKVQLAPENRRQIEFLFMGKTILTSSQQQLLDQASND